MRKTLINSLLLIAMLSSLSFCAEVQLPDYSGHVNDFAKILDSETAGKINFIADKLQENTGAEIAVVTIKSAYPLEPKAYATQLFEKWGIGKKNKDNGILVLFVKKDRRIEVEVGYGLEGTLPDGLVGAILDKYAIPQFKEKDYAKGLYLTCLAFYDKISKEYSSSPKTKIEQVNLNMFSVMLAFSVIIFVFVLAYLGKSLIGTLVAGILGGVIGFILSGIIGFIFGFIIGVAISKGGYYGSFGGGSWGQGFGGGGRGGFGGGRSGGGGAGRSF